MKAAQCDKKGRIYLKQSLRSRYGEKFVILEASSEIVLLPVPCDPVEDLADLGRPLKDHTLKQLREKILHRAKEEALE